MSKKENLTNVAIASGTNEIIQRYGSAAKEHLVAYSGSDNEVGRSYKRSLKSVSEQKINPKYKNQNLKQQAGFSAEIKESANANAEYIINKSPRRKIRTDDNNPLYDHVEIDGSGNIIDGSGSQMKFVGNSPQKALDSIMSKKFSKYLDNNAKIEVPSDYYDGILDETNKRISDLERQRARLLKNGNGEKAKQISEKIDKYNKIKKSLKKSSVSTKEAMFARQHPKLSTAKDIVKISHRAGMEAVGISAAIGGSVSTVQNIVAIFKDDKPVDEAVKDIIKDTVVSGGIGYGTTFASTIVKSTMQNAKSQTMRSLSSTNLPAMIVTTTITFSKSVHKYFNGEITGTEFLEQVGEQGSGMIASSIGATIGQAVIPIPIVGGIIGGMIGYALSSACYGNLMNSLKEAKVAREERLLIEKMCEEHRKLIRAYREELEKIIRIYLEDQARIFQESFDGIKQALAIGDIDGYISYTNRITKALGKQVLFESQEECDNLMLSGMTIKI
ncbi:hypothetical protein [Phascolarctobacterium sp.]|uniref:hypothetical protein n=1 Tax=Phascolarctobacterium sp. TaxID=2049039 RepID=UPI003870250E